MRKINDIVSEFENMILLAGELSNEPTTQDLTTEQFLQLCFDINFAEKEPNLSGKNIVVLERNVIQ